jgi:hypothetical protein
MELGGEPDLKITHALLLTVDAKLVGRPLQGIGVPKDGARIGEAVEIIFEIVVSFFEDFSPKPLWSLRWKLHTPLFGHLDEGLRSHRAPEMYMNIALG